jgi:WhiB family transcriptional regulator, redox-sensing transcriptional regulator
VDPRLKSRDTGTTRCSEATILNRVPITTSSPGTDRPNLPPAPGLILSLGIQLRTPSPVTSGGLPCQQIDPALWFSSVPAELNLAKAYCLGCRNRQPCLEGALERAEPTGVWGGEIFDKGRVIHFKRPRGRPRKTQ